MLNSQNVSIDKGSKAVRNLEDSSKINDIVSDDEIPFVQNEQ